MSTIVFTVIIAFIIVLVAVGLLGIGWLMTGKSKIRPGACGRNPGQDRDENCAEGNISCGLCHKKNTK